MNVFGRSLSQLKCLSCKHEDLGLILPTYIEQESNKLASIYKPNTGETVLILGGLWLPRLAYL